MSRSYRDFSDEAYEKPFKKRKNLRYNGREAFGYFSGEDFDDDDYMPRANEKSSIFMYRDVDRGVQGESSN